MTRDDIIRMAREHLVKSEYTEFGWQDCYRHEFDDDELVRFAELIAAHEREQCAKLCESFKTQNDYDRNDSCELLADAIRDNRWGKPWVG